MDYEKIMRGEKKKADMNNAQSEMLGQHGKKMAAGGVAKMRHGAATMSGAPKMQPRKGGRGK